MGTPITDINDFFPEFRRRLIAGDAEGLSEMYTKRARMSAINAVQPGEREFFVKGRDAIRARYSFCFGEQSYLDEVRADAGLIHVSADGAVASYHGPVMATMLHNETNLMNQTWSEVSEVYTNSETKGWRLATDNAYVFQYTPLDNHWRLDRYAEAIRDFEESAEFRDRLAHEPVQVLSSVIGTLTGFEINRINEVDPSDWSPHVLREIFVPTVRPMSW